jgi:hypothetical protein
MPISYQIDHEQRRIYTHCEGVVTYEEFRAHMNAEEGSAAASYGEIFDCTDATTNITPDQIRRLAAERQTVAERRKPAPVAMVATNDHFFGMLRMFDILTEQIRPMQVFRRIEAAEQWLDEIARRWGD